MTSDKVGTGLDTEPLNLAAVILDELFQAGDIEIALEGVEIVGVKTLLSHELYYIGTDAGDMRLCGGEVEVHRHEVTGLAESLSDDILAGTSLVCGEHVIKAHSLLYRFLEPVEGL